MSEKCEEVKKEKAVEDVSASNINMVKRFAVNILDVLKAYSTECDRDYKEYLGCSQGDRLSMKVSYPIYQQTQGCYVINKFLEQNSKITLRTHYSDGQRATPTFTNLEIKRDQYEPLLVHGTIFFEWNDMRSICSLWFYSDYAEANFCCSKDDWDTMQDFQAELREFFYEHNYFKGEKLEYLKYSRIGFLKYPKVSWSDLILKQELRDELYLNIIYPLENRDICKEFNIPWRRGVLLAGVPGTGKTLFGKVLCNVLENITVIWVTIKAVDDTRRVKTLFELARKFKPSLIIFEDIDFFGHDREFSVNPIVGELLNQLDGSTSNDGVFILATTNRPHLLDQALADRPNRFDVKLIFDSPELEERYKMVDLFQLIKSSV